MTMQKFRRCAVGDRYGFLVVQELIFAKKNPIALCLCDCGNKVTRQRGSLVRGKAISCGCIIKDIAPLNLIYKAISVITDKCIESPTCKNEYGYGIVRFNGRNERSHRVAYVHANGLKIKDIDGILIRHKCDNPPCINPLHLETGTYQDNINDMIERGRKKVAVGENAGSAKLTTEQVILIKSRLKNGESTSSIAKDFVVSAWQIWAIRVGRSWEHIE